MAISAKEWLKRGKWVADYTPRGSPRHEQRWRTNKDRVLEWVCFAIIALAMIGGVAGPIVYWELTSGA